MDRAETTDDDRRWAMLAHALALCGLVIPLADLLAPALVGRLGRQSTYVRFHARASLRFQVSCLVYEVIGLGALAVAYIVAGSQPAWPLIGPPDSSRSLVLVELLCLLWIAAITAIVVHAAAQARAGNWHRYPLTLGFLR